MFLQMKTYSLCFFFFIIFNSPLFGLETLLLRNNLQQAKPGDYIVISSSKTETLMHMYDKKENILTIEEIAVPENKRKSTHLGWKEWILQNAPGNTSWVMYDIDLTNGQMIRYYSFSKNNWFEIPDSDNFLSKLLNIKFTKVPEITRKKVGPKPISGPDWRKIWQPRMIIDSKIVPGVMFDAWRTKWPKDNSDLSGKTVEVYLPKTTNLFPPTSPIGSKSAE